MTHVEGTEEQFKAFMKSEISGPIHMLNLLKYKADGGRESYRKYGEHTAPLLAKSGGKVVYQSESRATVIGGEGWDDVLIVEYPSRQAFLDMILSEDYQKGVHLRHEGLEDSRLVCMQTP